MGFLLQEIKKMKFKYSVRSKNGLVSGQNTDYKTAFDESQTIIKTLFPNAALSSKLNDLVSEPNYLFYEFDKEFIYLEINQIDE